MSADKTIDVVYKPSFGEEMSFSVTISADDWQRLLHGEWVFQITNNISHDNLPNTPERIDTSKIYDRIHTQVLSFANGDEKLAGFMLDEVRDKMNDPLWEEIQDKFLSNLSDVSTTLAKLSPYKT